MKKTLCTGLQKLVCVLLIISLSGCTAAWGRAKASKISDKQLYPTVARIIDEQIEIIAPHIEEEFDFRSSGFPEGKNVVQQTLEEEQGRTYLEFCYSVSATNSVEDVLESAKSLMSEEDYSKLQGKVTEARSMFNTLGEEHARKLPPSQRAPFMKDLQKLVTQTVVLLTAAIVYACIPKLVLWGKIAAAAGIAIAAGIVASTVMSLWRFYEFNMDSGEAFEEWLQSVTVEPEAAYALAASMIAVGTSLKRSPVVTGLIIGVFAIYRVIDMIKPMLKKYNFTA